ncbi:MAG: immunoglobulin domain-containing protein [Verrucomicrobiota bacterium]|nr:immunoglobulin domain-containing protein [Verrucomicrobiota bacterium]
MPTPNEYYGSGLFQCLRFLALPVLLGCLSNPLAADTTVYSQEVQRLALDYGTTLTADPVFLAKVDHDLTAIRKVYPGLETIRYPDSVLDAVVFVELSPEGWQQYKNGTLTSLEAVRAELGGFVIEDDHFSSNWLWLIFDATNYNLAVAAQRVAALMPEAVYVGPNQWLFIGGHGLVYDKLADTYSFSARGGDCPSGCIYSREWTMQVKGEQVVLLSVSGTQPPVVQWQPMVYWYDVDAPARVALGKKLYLNNEYPKGVFTYQWYHGNKPLPATADGSLLIDPVTESDAGAYHCETTDTIEGTVVIAESFTVEVKPADYLWRKEEVSYSVGWDGFGINENNEHFFGYVDSSLDPLVRIHGFGWVYAFGSRPGHVWLFDSQLGWLYTSEAIYPFYYSYRDETWLYLNQPFWNGTERQFFNFTTQMWELIPFSKVVDLY